MHVGYRGPSVSATFVLGPRLLAHTRYGLVPSIEPSFELALRRENRKALFLRTGMNVPLVDSRAVTRYERRKHDDDFIIGPVPPSYYWEPVGVTRIDRGAPSLFVEMGVLFGR
jgi:hypothetical protein